jgi:hypothetical protein
MTNIAPREVFFTSEILRRFREVAVEVHGEDNLERIRGCSGKPASGSGG